MVYSVGDTVITKKNHPCGGQVWKIVRTGADVKLRCDKCGRVVLFSMPDFLKAIKKSKG